MATTNYSWNLPTVGGSENTWGTQLNSNWTALDTLLGGTNATEFAILDGATVTTAELNILDGVTATTAELNILDGVTATAAEINLLDGVTWTLTDYNTLTATAAELNVMSGITGIASQAEAEAGTVTDKLMTPERTKQAVEALSPGGLGQDQTWQNVGSSRSLNTTYTNNTGKPIMLNLVSNSVGSDTTVRIRVTIGSITLTIANESYPGGRGIYAAGNTVVPAGATYSVAMDYDGSSLGFSEWHELR